MNCRKRAVPTAFGFAGRRKSELARDRIQDEEYLTLRCHEGHLERHRISRVVDLVDGVEGTLNTLQSGEIVVLRQDDDGLDIIL